MAPIFLLLLFYIFIILLGIGISVIIFLLPYIIAAIIATKIILGRVFQKDMGKIIPRSELPEYITKFYEIKENQLLKLGFTYQYCIFTENSQDYLFMYYNPEKKTYVTLMDNVVDNLSPCRVKFETHFKNDKKLVTHNGLVITLCKTIPNIILKNAYAETLEKHFQFHLQCVAEIAKYEGEIKEFDSSESEQTLLKKFNQNQEDYFNHLLKQDIIYKLDENKYGIKPLASLGIAYRLISDLKKKKITLKSWGEGMIDIPVELRAD